ncbi:tRNA adenosine(34) deaminase TadA [Reinekea marinisedimentorum]|uniref:tRNA-specific adenosine deaminase n=1 Tax=Reinekea marinisedimentorum TaxID=230495 RepID=A0A4V2UJZ3_9GAMM|nr:tRNA adenosine(34) deaminase TadA [Reinekea marinisedimentorum]TCS41999.1 tRNA(adenine34) deaminase [Reinekea marinisedimentorum]
MCSRQSDQAFMRRALALADTAAQHGEVPVGAVVVYEGEVIGEGYNQPITSLDPSAHAEMVAIREAAKNIGNYRLVDCTLYVTVEPCTMCTGLLVHSRIGRLVFGAAETKAGAICSAMDVQKLEHLNHKFVIESGVLADECSAKMTAFFQQRRERKKQLRQAAKPHKED